MNGCFTTEKAATSALPYSDPGGRTEKKEDTRQKAWTLGYLLVSHPVQNIAPKTEKQLPNIVPVVFDTLFMCLQIGSGTGKKRSFMQQVNPQIAEHRANSGIQCTKSKSKYKSANGIYFCPAIVKSTE